MLKVITMKSLYDKEYFDKRMGYSVRKHPHQRMFNAIRPFLTHKESKVLDVGCGTGEFVKFLREKGIDAYGTDWSDAIDELFFDKKYFIKADAINLPFMDLEFDVVTSSDFFEHIPEHEISAVLNEQLRVGCNVFARICFKKENPYHLTVKPKSWWEEKTGGRVGLIR